MATVSAEVRFAPQLTAWFTANPTKVLQNGEIVYCSDGANVGKYVIGDNSTQLSALTFYGGISASGLTVGTTTITGGTSTRVLYNNAGVVGEYAVTGTGTTAVLSTSPTFVTDITTPLIIGGSAVGSLVTYKSTSGTGTTTAIGHAFVGGTNGGTTIASLYNNGNVNIGNKVTTSQRILRIGQDTGWVDIGSLIGSTSLGAIYINQATPSGSNYSISSTGSNLLINSTDAFNFRISDSTKFSITSAGQIFTFSPTVSTSGANINFTLNTSANTNQTLSTNIPNFKVTGSTKQWATGALANQYWNYLSANTAAFVGASTMTNSYSLFVESAIQGTNATITNNYSLGTNGKAKFGGNIELTQTVTTEALVSDTSVTIVINGVTYKLLAKA